MIRLLHFKGSLSATEINDSKLYCNVFQQLNINQGISNACRILTKFDSIQSIMHKCKGRSKVKIRKMERVTLNTTLKIQNN